MVTLTRNVPDDNIVKNRAGTIAYQVLGQHNVSKREDALAIKFDALASHDITYVGVVQTARASGMTEFPIPYVLTNCHNSLCAVGGTINADDHAFGLSAARKYGGEFVPPHLAVIHTYMRENYAAGGRMILASDSHTRYGAFGTLAIGEGGPELVKQLLGRTYDLAPPPVWEVRLSGRLRRGVGAQDVALALIAKAFPAVKNCVLEFTGEGIASLDMDTRAGIDVMTTETTCLSSIWQTDSVVRDWLTLHGRAGDYKELKPLDGACYDGLIEIDLSAVEPMIALPFHPSRAYTVREFKANAVDLLRETEKEAHKLWGFSPDLTRYVQNGEVRVSQGIIAGCAGGLYGNLCHTAAILDAASVAMNGDFDLSVYPSSQPMWLELSKNGVISKLAEHGVIVRTAFCGPCFGAGDVPADGGFSLRHTTRNFPNREGSKPAQGQSAFTALADARTIAATAANGGILTGADTVDYAEPNLPYNFDPSPYKKRVFYGVNNRDKSAELRFGPGITDWPEQAALSDKIELTIASVILDEVTTTDELIPSGETSSHRSNPEYLSEFTLSRRDPNYVSRAKETRERERERRLNGGKTELGSVIVVKKPGDGSAREQAASCQRVLGGLANISAEYATKRYRSNLINWGILPFICEDFDNINWKTGGVIKIDNVFASLKTGIFEAYFNGKPIILKLPELTRDEADVLIAGCLINYYKKG